MKRFPSDFAPEPVYLRPDQTDGKIREALQTLAEKGFRIQIGLTRADTAPLQELSVQASIRKYCPKDCTERFKDVPTIEHWLTKERLVFLLKETATDELAGIAWTGPGTSPHISGGKLTGGVRLSEHFQGLGLATPFLTAALTYTRENYSDDLLWYECWQSNSGALHIYQKLGFQIVQTEPGQRVTPDGSHESDTRVYMKLTEEWS